MGGAPTRRQAIAGVAATLGVLALGARRAFGATADKVVRGDDISHSEESIHMEVVFKANRKRVYAVLTEVKLFEKVIQQSAAMKGGMPPGAAPAAISSEAGGAFTLFGGHISGRHVELVAGERVVQAWRASNWGAGVFSIAKFALVEQGSDTKLVFDHTGFPKGESETLAAGWKANYWEPMAKVLAQ
jgi:activator of HSP90 ATPase